MNFSTLKKPLFPQILVIDRLEVGPVKLEKRRLIAPYTVVKGTFSEQTELIFSYEEDVFTPGEAASQQLANMIAAQIALNYGLFCKQIVFHGAFTEVDRQFLLAMADNTATEIYVNKLLQPNPFLIGDAAKLPVLRKKSYLQSTLVFPDPLLEKLPQWQGDTKKIAILSSGGKDSLLSYGVLNEIGYEVHPIFGNESGRHWFTALNSYRHFRDHVPHTARVWMNSDRLFSWMLRRLPFIRQDFATIRADIYPIRLWTVAVFLFSILPLVRKRGIARVVIGDEYDSTWVDAYEGIEHYSGLYDQSRFFDEALSQYFQQNGWGLQQFSVLRPLSEMLILKILVNRYPDLQMHQVSCHASHKEGERVHPCGKCEKCRRIVGMLVAFGADPQRCGYSPAQISHCLNDLKTKGVHQESAGAQHLLWLLTQRGHLTLPPREQELLKSHPNIMKLRFHPDRSPVDLLPKDLRKPLFKLYLEHANGTVRHNGEKWMSYDPLNDKTFDKTQ